MGNILDYLDWRGDLTFEQSPFNEVDNLILACFSYLDLDEMAEVKNGNTLSVEELFAAFSRREMKKDLKAESAFLQNTPVLLEKMACAERFRKCTVGGFVNEIISSQAQQFAAVTIGLDDGTTYISFRGTDDTIVGWKEDFNLSNGVVPSHRKALGYLETHGTYIQSMLRIGGHSKGGNLAIVSAMECKSNIFNKIKRIDNFDGPGLRKEEYSAKKYKRIISKLNNYLPSDSFVGSLLYNSNYTYIKSNGIGIKVHYPYSWLLFGEEFIKQKASTFSSKIHDITTNGISKINQNDLQKTFDTIINYVIDNKKAKINFKEIYNIILNTKDIDKTTKDYLIKILTILGNELIKPKKEK